MYSMEAESTLGTHRPYPRTTLLNLFSSISFQDFIDLKLDPDIQKAGKFFCISLMKLLNHYFLADFPIVHYGFIAALIRLNWGQP